MVQYNPRVHTDVHCIHAVVLIVDDNSPRMDDNFPRMDD